MPEYNSNQTVVKPTSCPFCNGKIIDTLAKVLTTRTMWRCLSCQGTWTLDSLAASRPRPR